MNATMVARRNGHPPIPRSTTIIPLLAAKVDQLDRLRTRLADLQAAERQLTDELLAAMAAHGLARLAGFWTVATVEEETALVALADLTSAERRRIGEADVQVEDLEHVQVAVRRAVLHTMPTPAPKAVAS